MPLLSAVERGSGGRLACVHSTLAQGRWAVGPLEQGRTTVMVHSSSGSSMAKRTARLVLGLQLCAGEQGLDVFVFRVSYSSVYVLVECQVPFFLLL